MTEISLIEDPVVAGTAATTEAPAHTQGPDPLQVESARGVIAAYLKAMRANLLYPEKSRIRTDHLLEFSAKLCAHVQAWGETGFRIRQTKITCGSNTVYEEENRARSLAFRLFVNGVRRITVSPGVTAEEGAAFVEVLARSYDKEATSDDLRTAVWERGFEHVLFAMTDDLFTPQQEKDFAEFVQADRVVHASAAQVRAETDDEIAEIAAIPPPAASEDDEASSLSLTYEERLSLPSHLQTESERDLFGEFSEYLLDVLTSAGGEAVQTQLAEFLEHVTAAGEILRAARFLNSLRGLATATEDTSKRSLLVDVVERIGKTRIVPKIRPLLPSLAEGDQAALFMLLTAVGEAAIAPLCDLLDSPARDGAESALRVLVPRHPKALLPFLTDPRACVARSAIVLIAEHGSEELAGAFLPALRHADVGVRREALRALAKFGGRHATGLFLAALADPGYEVRALALSALGDSRDPRAAQPLLLRVGSGSFHALSTYEKRETFRTLARIATPEVTTALIRMLRTKSLLKRSRNEEIRALAASALGMVATQPARDALSSHENDRCDEVRRAVRAALRVTQTQAGPSTASP